jgi:membrane protease YdiL (CAAX protease family)
VNDSTSQTSPAWPTRWPKGSFSPWWTFGFIALLVWAVFVLWIVAGLAAVFWLAANDHQAELTSAIRNPATMSSAVFVSQTIAQLVGEAAGVVLILVALPLLTHFSIRDLGFRAIDARVIGYALLGAIGMILIADFGSTLIENATHAVHPQLVERIFEHLRHQKSALIFFVLFAVVLQPVAEETIFRVLIFNIGLRYGGFWTGAIVSGALFGLAHTATGGTDIVSGILLAFGGMILCWVYYRSRNAYASMISHGLFNALSTAALYFAPKLAGG